MMDPFGQMGQGQMPGMQQGQMPSRMPQGGIQYNPQQPFSLYQTLMPPKQPQVSQPGPPQFQQMMFHQAPQQPNPQMMQMMISRMGGQPGMGGQGMPPQMNQGMGQQGNQLPNPFMLMMKLIHDKQQHAMQMPQAIMQQRAQPKGY